MSEFNNNDQAEERNEGQITYATEVISTIVNVATLEVEGIAGITGGSTISGIIGKGRGPKGIRVDVKGEHVSVDISVSVDYGIPIQKVGRNVQENVRKSIETMTGMQVDKVDLHVVSVSFEKENKAMEKSQNKAIALEEEEEAHAAEEPVEEAKEPADDVEEEAEEKAEAAEETDPQEEPVVEFGEDSEPEEAPEESEPVPEETEVLEDDDQVLEILDMKEPETEEPAEESGEKAE